MKTPLLTHRALLLIALTLMLCSGVTAQVYFPYPPPGSVYKEFISTFDLGNESWRVNDPNIDLGVYPQAGAFLPNPTLYLTVDDLSGATSAEALLVIWGGHVGTTDKRVSFNGNSWITIPELNTGVNGIPSGGSGQCYTAQFNAVVDVPLEHLNPGGNSFQGYCGGQTCYSFGWGQFGWYGIVLRVYYDPGSKTHTTGSISSPSSGATIGEFASVSASASGAANKIEIVGYYEGFDTDNNHVGTISGSSGSVTWNNNWVADQSGIKLLARIQGTNGVWYVTPEVTSITLARSSGYVAFSRPYGVPERMWARGDINGGYQYCYADVSTTTDATGVLLHMRLWNGNDDGGSGHHIKFNGGYTAPTIGYGHFYSYNELGPPTSALLSGTNTSEFYSSTTDHHGLEVLWPGVGVSVRYGSAPVPIELGSFAATFVANGSVEIKWTTISEINNYGFEIQRSPDRSDAYETIPGSFTPGHGTTLTPHSYSYTDTDPHDGVAYYRLKQIDLDNTVHLYEGVRVNPVTGVGDESLPRQYSLRQNHPNPFNPSTVIRYSLKQEGDVLLRVFNVLGETVGTLVQERQGAGEYSVNFDASGLGSGVYYYRLESGLFVASKKMVLLK
jgi:hypothetical protein